jgi:TolA-binding protein
LLHGEAEEIRREIVEEFPRAPEAPPALLSLARSMIARNAPSQDVRLLLERMILEYPRSALLPQARRELDRLAEPRGRH